MTLPPDLPDEMRPSIGDAYRVYPVQDLPKPSGALIYGLSAVIALVVSLIALGLAVLP